MNTDQAPTIPQLFRATAAARGDQPAICFVDREVCFGEIDRASDGIAAALAGRGIGKGDRVALYCINSEQFAITYLGIIKAGVVVVPVNLLLNPREIIYILRDAGVRGLFYHQALAQTVAAFRGELDGLCFSALIGGQTPAEGELLYDEMTRAGGEPPTPEIDSGEDLAAILYTSGTTGHPKGAMLTHRNLVSNTRSVMRAMAFEPGRERLLVVLPMFHSFAATVGTLTPLLHGLSLAPLPKFDPALVCDAIEVTGATIFLGVPSMYSVLLRLSDAQVAQWKSIRYCISGGRRCRWR